MILTNKQHRQMHARWAKWKADNAVLIPAVHALFKLVDDFGIDPNYLLDGMLVPPTSPLWSRETLLAQVNSMIRERHRFANGGYMARSVILGWIVDQIDVLLTEDGPC